jgi:hypothetical protein
MDMNSPEYIGHFTSCAAAQNHVNENYPDAEYTSCLYQDYIYLPETIIKKEIK